MTLSYDDVLEVYEKHVTERLVDRNTPTVVSCDTHPAHTYYINTELSHRSHSISCFTFVGKDDEYLAVATTQGLVKIFSIAILVLGDDYLVVTGTLTVLSARVINWKTSCVTIVPDITRYVREKDMILPFGKKYLLCGVVILDVETWDTWPIMDNIQGLSYQFLPHKQVLIAGHNGVYKHDLKTKKTYETSLPGHHDQVQTVTENVFITKDLVVGIDTMEPILRKKGMFWDVLYFQGDYGVRVTWDFVTIVNCLTGEVVLKADLTSGSITDQSAMSYKNGQIALKTDYGYIFVYRLFIPQSKDVKRMMQGLFERRELYCDLLIRAS
jgi:hypothetical protein